MLKRGKHERHLDQLVLADDARHYVTRWAAEMRVPEDEILNRLVRNAVLLANVHHVKDILLDLGHALPAPTPFGVQRQVILDAIASAPGEWDIRGIIDHVRAHQAFELKPKVVAHYLVKLRREGAIVVVRRGVVRRREQ
jgi:hypothetical protein